MKLKRIEVSKLFNIFDHPIELNQEEHITIIHGPNGYGKTVILRMLDGLFNSRFNIFRSIPFEEFKVEFTDGRSIQIIKPDEKNIKHRDEQRVIVLGPERDQIFELGSIDREKLPFPIGMIEDIVPGIVRSGPREWVDQENMETLTLDEVIIRYEEYFPNGLFKSLFKSHKWLDEIRTEIPVHFIRTERLITRLPRIMYQSKIDRYPESSSTVVRYSKELAESIQDTLAKSVEFSSSLDRSFPSRLMNFIKQGEAPELSEDELRDNLFDLEQKRSRLMEAGLLERGEVDVDIPDESLSTEMLKVLSMYANDVDKKLSLFDDDQRKIELFQKR